MAYTYGTPLTPAESRYRQIAEAMLVKGINPGITMGGIGGIGQGIGGLAQAFVGKRLSDRADAERQAATDKAMSSLSGLGLDPQKLALVKAITGMDPMAGLQAGAGILPQTKEPEEFTLSPGQTRYRGDQAIASLPAGPDKPEWLEAKGPGNITFKYRPDTRETNLSKPGGGFYTLDEIGGGGMTPTGSIPMGGPETITTEPLQAAGQPAPEAYEGTIQNAAAQFGIPPDLLREHLRIESAGFDPDVIAGKRLSQAGAIGIGQFMPDTAAGMGIDPTDPQESIYAAAQYLAEQKQKFGSWQNAIAAYNWGPGNLEKQGILRAPEETRRHLAKLQPWLGGGQQPAKETQVAAGDDFWAQYAAPDKSRETPAGAFGGTSMDAQAWNIIMAGNANSPEYAAAYNMLFEQPKMIQTENGMVPVTMPVPPFVKKPTAAGQQQAQATGQPTTGQPIPGTEKPTTEYERASAGFVGRMEAAEPTIEQYSTSASSGWQNFLNNVPGGNYMQSDEYQQVRQAQEDWVRAKLRKESGAVIGEEEMNSEIRLYFPQPGDSQAVIDQKKKSRQQALDGMRLQAGRAVQGKVKRWKIVDGQLVPE